MQQKLKIESKILTTIEQCKLGGGGERGEGG